MRAPSVVSRLLRRPEGPAPVPGAEPSPRPPRRPTPGQLRRERRALVRAREERLRDLGGIMLEMFKRNRFNEQLVSDRCDELVGIEQRLQEVDMMLAQAAAARRGPVGADRCVCGAPVLWGSHFCANCGRAVGEAPVISCVHCGTPLPAEAAFCSSCGNPTGEPASAGAASGDGEAPAGGESPARDPAAP